MPFMKFFPADYLRDTDILSLSAQGAWMRMICAAWHPTRKGILSFPLPTVARLIHTDEPDARRILAEIEDCGIADFQWSADRQAVTITCRRVVRDWQTATENKADISEKRSKAAHERWEKERLKREGEKQSKCNASASQMECPLESRNQNPESRGQNPSPLSSPKGEARKPAKKFQKPTLEEVAAYARTLDPPGIDAEKFMAHYKANGWRVGKNPMNDWKAAVDYWHRGDNPTAKPRPNEAGELFGNSHTESDLAEIVALYPKRERQAEAVAALAKHVAQGADLDAVASGTRAIAAIILRMPGGPLNAYVPSAAKFFQNRRWQDDPKTWLRNAGKNGAPIEELYQGGRRGTTIEIQCPPSKP
jgi:uncharacterized protein YdaU (DUF1376 family)